MKVVLTNIAVIILTFRCTVYCSIDLKYDYKVAYTEDGLECINNCVKGKCVIDNSQRLHNCKNTNIDAPVHRTIQNVICLSRCFKVPKYTGKCYINQNGESDYCESSRTVEWIRDRSFSDSQGPCKDICRANCKNCRSRCNHYWGGSDYCDLGDVYNYIQARTMSGKLCRGMCGAHEGRDYNWCYYSNGGVAKAEACALPGLPRQHDWTTEIQELIDIKTPICIRIREENIYKLNSQSELKDGIDALLNRLARDLESDPKHDTVHLRYTSSPINSYTIRSKSPRLPYVVRAVIRPRHIFYKKDVSDEEIRLPTEIKDILGKTKKLYNDDEEGYLVSFFMSGSQEKYNVYYRRPTQYDENVRIFKFLEGNKSVYEVKVDLLVVVLYRDGATRPSGIARRLKFYHSDLLVNEYYEYLPNESGNSKMPSSFGDRSLLPPVNFTESNKDGDCYISNPLSDFDEDLYEFDLGNNN